MSQLITDKEVASLLSIHVATVWRMVQRGVLPQPIRLGTRCTRWSLEAVKAAVERHQVTSS